VIVAAGVVALGVVVYVGRLWAQAPAAPVPPAAEPRTRVALLNLTYVITKYNKYINFQNEMKKVVEPYQQKDKDKKALGENLAKEAQAPATTAARRDAIEKELRTLQREIEDNKAEAKKVVDKKQEEQLKILYGDVQDACRRYAVAHNFDLVLHYNDATTKEDYYSAANIARKMQAGACVPLYATPGMDISEQVVATLNAAFPQAPAAAAPAPAAPAAGGTH
jgi:Skp family chaperone for outer membrane proteins